MLFVVIGHGISHYMILTPFFFPALPGVEDPAVIPRRGSSVESFTHSASEPSQLTTMICPGYSLKLQ